MISEFERIVNNTSLNDYKFINTSGILNYFFKKFFIC